MKINSMLVEDVVTSLGDISVEEAISTLYHKHIGSIIVIDKDGKCEGIFTERDAIRIVATKVPLSTPLKRVMTTNLKTVEEGATFAEAKNIMRINNIRHLPVTDKHGHLIGLLSLRTIFDEIHNMQAVKR
ncbi:MAG: CBS domain-containing protein [Candidatus Thorarchaeota archaeon]